MKRKSWSRRLVRWTFWLETEKRLYMWHMLFLFCVPPAQILLISEYKIKFPTKSFKSIKFRRFSRTHPFSQLRALHISASIESTYIYSSASFRSRSSAILHPISHFHGTPNKRCIILRPQSNGSNKCH